MGAVPHILNGDDPMKRLLVVAVALSLAPGIGLAQGSVEQALKDLEQQWTKAGLASNPDALAPLLSDDFVSIDSDGSMHAKAEVLARTKRAKWEKNEISGMKVQVHGTAAVVTGVWTGKGVDGTGKAVNSRERWADTWVKMASGKWQCVASASAAIK